MTPGPAGSHVALLSRVRTTRKQADQPSDLLIIPASSLANPFTENVINRTYKCKSGSVFLAKFDIKQLFKRVWVVAVTAVLVQRADAVRRRFQGIIGGGRAATTAEIRQPNCFLPLVISLTPMFKHQYIRLLAKCQENNGLMIRKH